MLIPPTLQRIIKSPAVAPTFSDSLAEREYANTLINVWAALPPSCEVQEEPVKHEIMAATRALIQHAVALGGIARIVIHAQMTNIEGLFSVHKINDVLDSGLFHLVNDTMAATIPRAQYPNDGLEGAIQAVMKNNHPILRPGYIAPKTRSGPPIVSQKR